MKGIRKKINIGFLILAVLLLFSGMVSLAELSRLSNRTNSLLESSSYNIELSKRMLDAMELQNSSLLQMIVLRDEQYDSSFLAGRREFDLALREAAGREEISTTLDSVVVARDAYQRLVTEYFDEQHHTDVAWFLTMYKTSYNRLTTSIKEYMTSSQYSLVSRAKQLENNAYRAITPGILTLYVAILVIFMFMFLIDFYYTRPLVKISRGLNDYLKFNAPFNPKVEGRDELLSLRENIEALISTIKSKH